MSAGPADIARCLDEAKRRRRQVILAAAAAAGLAGAAAVLLAGAAALHLGARPAPVRGLALTGAGLALAGALAWAWRVLRREVWSDTGTARTVTRSAPALRSDLVSAVELLRARPGLAKSEAVSLALLDAHVERTAQALRAIDLGVAIPDWPARRAGLVLLGVALLHAVSFLAGGRPLGRAWGHLLAGAPAAAAAPSLDPITGDIELTFRFPAYTRRPPQVISGTGGEIRAPRGTEVALKTRADRPIDAAEIEITSATPTAEPAGPPSGPPGVLDMPAVPPSVPPAVPPAVPDMQPTEPATAPIPSRPETVVPGTPNLVPGMPRGTPSQRPGMAGPPKGQAEPRTGSTARTSPPRPLATRRIALTVANRRDLAGTLLLSDAGTYRFRFTTSGGRTLAEGPPIPMGVEPDAFPTVRITAPAAEVEVKADAVVRVDWQAEDDYGLEGLELVTRTPGGAEHRRPLRALSGLRRDAGSFELPLQAERLGEGERLLYWLEVVDGDTVSGPKKGASATQTVRIYSEAEHRRAALEKARAAWEELVALLGDRLETFATGQVSTPTRLPAIVALDARARALHERLRQVAGEVARERAAPREVAAALLNVASGLRTAEQRVTVSRQALMRTLGLRQPADGLSAQLAVLDRLLDEELERGILYLEQLFDKARAEDLVRLAKDLAAGRRDLQQMLERYRDAPGEAAKQELLAQIRRVRQRMESLMARMAETARGFHDEHMNAEALAELAKEKDLKTGLDAAEEALQRGDVAAAMKALDEMGGQLDQMLAGLQRTSERPDAAQAGLMKEMLAFKKELEQVQSEQEKAAAETEQVKAALRRRLADKLEQARQATRRLEELAKAARAELQQAQGGTPERAEQDLDAAQEATADLQRALAMKDLEASQEMAQRALAPARRLAATLEEDAALAERVPGATSKDPLSLREAQRHARQAGQKLAEVGRELSKLQPDPRQALTPGEAGKLDELARRQGGLERRAGELQQKLAQLMQQAPVFPQGAPQLLGESRGHMGQAAGELSQRNAPRGHGEQQQALDALGRFKEGLEKMAKRGGKPGGGGFPFPFGEPGGDGRDGDAGDPMPEKVEIPGAEAHRVPEAFRKDLLEAMKQGAPERYRGEVQRYYEELVK
jgi:hypothetical protein